MTICKHASLFSTLSLSMQVPTYSQKYKIYSVYSNYYPKPKCLNLGYFGGKPRTLQPHDSGTSAPIEILYGSFRKLRVPYFGVLIIRILLFRVLLYSGPLFRKLPYPKPQAHKQILNPKAQKLQTKILNCKNPRLTELALEPKLQEGFRGFPFRQKGFRVGLGFRTSGHRIGGALGSKSTCGFNHLLLRGPYTNIQGS